MNLTTKQKITLAQSPDATAEELELLADDGFYHIRSYVALNQNCTAHLLEKLLKDKNNIVHTCAIEKLNEKLILARSPDTSAKQLDELAKYEDSKIRQFVLKNPNCPSNVLDLLSDDKNLSGLIAKHPNCPVNILEKLSDDGDFRSRACIASRSDCPEHLLEKFSDDSDFYVRCRVVLNSNCPLHLLEKLSSDKDGSVRSSVAEHPNCPVHLLEKLANDNNFSVRASAIRNPHCPLHLQITIQDLINSYGKL